ncbi:MAG: PBP1A family penicillin-binding protein [Calditrichaeota bacterium]|nr:MAG: PBP1A family penicillin-binding protein [Calditrichota bacterium]
MSEYLLDKHHEPESPQKSPKFSRPRLTRAQMYLIGGGVLALGLLISFIILIRGMPDLTELENVNPAQVTRIYSADGKVIHELFKLNRIWIPYDSIPEHVIQAALATEDREFFDHWGVNLKRVPRAMLVNLLSLRFKQGFSTITMQVARNLYVRKIGFDKSIFRKLREIFTAIQIERTYSKKEILEMYLNLAFFGRSAYGIESAAQRYFNKSARDLTVEEGAFLIGLLKGPGDYSPTRHPERALRRRNLVMHNMLVCNYLDRATYDSLKQLPIAVTRYTGRSSVAPYFTEYVRQKLNALQDSLGVNIYEDGLKVYTTLNTVYQAAMDSAIARQMPAIQEKVTQHLLKWKEENHVPDSVFAEKSQVQIAMVALDHRTGHILGMVGGRDFEKSKFNRAVQARRQPGSTFKAFLYTAAIDNGYTPVDRLLNQPIVINQPDGTRWTPENFERKYGGLTTLRTALAKSINLIAARLILEVGPQQVVEYARRLGIKSPLRPYPSLAMGSSDVTLLEMVSAFGVFANQGIRVEPVAITRIEDRNGNVIYRKRPHRTEALSRATAYIITTMLEDVVNRGTGGSIRWRFNWYVPAAGKTGTTNDYSDAWFIGFTPYVTAGVWVGLDDHSLKLGRIGTGSRAALPFWADFMKTVYDSLKIPPEEFKQPPDVVRLDVCEESGKIATNFCPVVIHNEVFNIKYRPKETCDLHPGINTRRKRKSVTF